MSIKLNDYVAATKQSDSSWDLPFSI
jgi:hypothetical protein